MVAIREFQRLMSVYTGGGFDVVHAHYGHGEIHCDSPGMIVYLSRQSRRG